MTRDIVVEPARADDLTALLALLEAQQLPRAGLDAHLATAFVARHRDRIVGSAALEAYEDGLLLRSVAVDAAMQGEGVGARLVEAALGFGERLKAPAVYLLTTTAEEYFPRFGFETIDRRDVPAGVRQSIEFTSACPASAVVMRRRLTAP